MLYIFYQIVEGTLIFELRKGEIFGNFAFSHNGYFLIVSGNFLKIVPLKELNVLNIYVTV